MVRVTVRVRHAPVGGQMVLPVASGADRQLR